MIKRNVNFFVFWCFNKVPCLTYETRNVIMQSVLSTEIKIKGVKV